ncbi:hypothetical protein [Streptomonospora arabica]|uniref:Uncharacterized protein n=1 Tax=Streptomonospora arabica TaxID=412417 RepID=A0ABV9SID5_9ACTN
MLGAGAAGTLPASVPWRYRVNDPGEVPYPGSYEVGIVVSGHVEHTVHYEPGLFDSGRCLGAADAAAPRGDLPDSALADAARHPSGGVTT